MAEVVPEAKVAPAISLVALGEIVTISIGSDKKLYHVHKDLICHYSEYFRTAYNGRWKEAQDGIVLEFVEMEVFNIFIHWIYTLRLPESVDDLFRISGANKGASPDDGMWKEYMLLMLQSCIFGDRFLATEFVKEVHNHYVNLMKGGAPFYEHVKYAFNNLCEDHQLLNYLVDLHCIHWRPESDNKHEGEVEARESLPNRFLIRVMLRNYEYKGLADKKMKLCDYHLHDSDEERSACVQEAEESAEA